MARYDVDKIIYRASVENIAEVNNKHLVKVRFIDYGNTAEVGRLHLYHWEANLEVIPPQAVCCKLKNLERISKTVLPDTEEHLAFSKIMKSINPLQVSIHEKLFNSSFHSRHHYMPQLVVSVHDKYSESIYDKLKFSPLFREVIMDTQSVSASYFSSDTINRDRLEILDYKPPSKLSKVPEPLHLVDCQDVDDVDEGPRSPVHPLLTNRAVEKVTWWLERKDDESPTVVDNDLRDQEESTLLEVEGVRAIDFNDNVVKSRDLVSTQSSPPKKMTRPRSSDTDSDKENRTKELVNKLRSVKAASSLSSSSGHTKTKKEISKEVEDTRALLSKAKVTKSRLSTNKPQGKEDEIGSSSKGTKKTRQGPRPKQSFSSKSNMVFTHDSSYPGMDIRYREDQQGQKEHRDLPPVIATSQRIEVCNSIALMVLVAT